MRNKTAAEDAAANAALANQAKGPELARLLRSYRRGNSQPRLIDIASASPRGNAEVVRVLRAFAK